MDKSELHQLFKTNPLLAIQVASFGEEKLGQIEVLTPSNMPQKYQEFCQKLQLGDPPALVVCPAEFHGKLHGNQQSIFYTMFTNSVWMPRSVLEKLTNDDPKAKYVTAHELGHASGRMNRRNFLKSFGVATAGGLMAGTATTTLLNEATKDPDTVQKLGGDKLRGIFKPMVGTTAGLATTSALLKLLLPALREEEFSADDYAKQALGLVGIIEPLTERALVECSRKGYRDVVEQVKAFETMLRGEAESLTPDQKLQVALKTIRLIDKKIPVSQIVDKNIYPDFAARLARHETEITAQLR